MPKSLQYVTKIQELKGVVLEGKLAYVSSDDPDHSGGWRVTRSPIGPPSASDSDDLEEWLEKFAGKEVVLSIRTFERDESHLLPSDEGATA